MLATHDIRSLEGVEHSRLFGGRTAPIRHRGVVAFAARRAKELSADAIIVLSHILFRTSPLTEEFSDKLVRQVFRGARARAGEATTRSKPRRVKPA